MNSLAGHLLVAVPQLPDSNFYRTVVLMIQHDPEGAFGLVLNRPSGHQLGEVWQQVTGKTLESELDLNLGGPVEGPVMVLHNAANFADAQVLDGVYVSSQQHQIKGLIESHCSPIKVFSGYSGWAPSQLDHELVQGGWIVAPCSFDYVFGDHDDLWKRVTQDIGHRILLETVDQRLVPPDPSMN